MKYIQPISDIHLEFADLDIQSLNPNKETILLIMGDIGVSYSSIDFLINAAKQYYYVIFVLGNHDYWKGDLFEFPDNYKMHLETAIQHENISNIKLLQDDYIDLAGCRFIGGTIWTNYDKGSPFVIWDAETNMRDFSKIRKHNRSTRVRAFDFIEAHKKTVKYITNNLSDTLINIVMTHHAPYSLDFTRQSEFAYCSDLSNEILYSDNPISIWFHGHLHNTLKYKIDEYSNTWIMCNPRGYIPLEPNINFNPDLKIAIGEIHE